METLLNQLSQSLTEQSSSRLPWRFRGRYSLFVQSCVLATNPRLVIGYVGAIQKESQEGSPLLFNVHPRSLNYLYDSWAIASFVGGLFA